MTRISSWNVNSIKARLGHVRDWLGTFAPDIALLQEIKCTDEAFPRLEIEELGYNVVLSGQKSYNGVAILSKTPVEVAQERLPGGAEDEQARYLEIVTDTGAGTVRVASIYLPNGNPPDTEKFAYKLAWMERLTAHAQGLLALEEPVVLGGDYNVIPQEEDVWNPASWEGDALFRPESRGAFHALCHLGYTDAYRALHRDRGAYTFWDYQAGAWQKDHGIRIDHLLLSPQAADRLTRAEIDRGPRGKAKASDHTPIWCELAPPLAAKAAA